MSNENLKKHIEELNERVAAGETVNVSMRDDDGAAARVTVDEKGARRAKKSAAGDEAMGIDAPAADLQLDFAADVSDDEIAEKIKQASNNPPALGAVADDLPRVVITRDEEKKVWVLVEKSSYQTAGHTITAPAAFETDLSSIPRVFWSLLAPEELSLAAPVFHDLIYRRAGKLPEEDIDPFDGKVFARKEVDDLFLELMTKAGIPRWKRTAAYLAVRGFAAFAWRDQNPPNDEVKIAPDHDLAAVEETDGGENFAAADDDMTFSLAPRPWRVARSLLALRDQINHKFPSRSKASDGTIGDAAHASRSSDHNPWVIDGADGVVTAMDITHDPLHGCSGETLAEAIRAARDSRVKYIIWNRRISNSSLIGGAAAWQWRAYHGTNGHTHHVHISVKSDKAHYDSTAPWGV